MRSSLLPALALVLANATGASAMTHGNGSPVFGARVAAADPDERAARLAVAATPHDQSRAKPSRSWRSVLKDDPYLRAAFASLDNK